MSDDLKLLSRFEIDDPDRGRHYIEVEESTHTLQRAYQPFTTVKLLHLSHHFPGIIYGTGCLAGMEPGTALKVGRLMVEWGEANLGQ